MGRVRLELMTEKEKSQSRPRYTGNLKGRTVLSAVADGDLAPNQRAALLEAMNALVNDMTIIRRFVSHRHIDAEILRLRDDDGRAWIRQLDEAEQALIDQASL